MKKLLIVINTLGRAGAEKALISLLRSLDYSRVSVSLLSIVGRGELFADIPPQVKVLNRKPSQGPVLGLRGSLHIAGVFLARMFRRGYIVRHIPYAARNISHQLRTGWLQLDKLLWPMLAGTATASDEEYDLAVAFIEGAATYYVADRVNARVKMAFVHINYEKAGYIKELDHHYYAKMDYICCVSDPVKRALAEDSFPDLAGRMRVFPNIVSRAEIMRAAEDGKGFTDGYNGLRIVTVARLHPQKGIDLAVGAFAKLAGADARWYVLGGGAERPALERLIKKHELKGRFVLLGAMDNPLPFVAQADIYVQPSRFEGMGLSLLEALFLGRPCVTTDFDGLPHLLHDGVDALIVQPTVEELTEAIGRLVRDEKLRGGLGAAAVQADIELPSRLDMLYAIMEGTYWEMA